VLLEYSAQGRAERLIAGGRLVLTACSLLALALDPIERVRHVTLSYALLVPYLGYAAAVAGLAWGARPLPGRLRLLTHVLDLGVFTLLMYATEGPSSPFFVFFVFALACATLRWQWRGTLWTAAAALSAFVGMGVYTAYAVGDPEFALNRFVIRTAYLAVVAVLLGNLGAYERRARDDMARLAAWPAAVPSGGPALVEETLAHAAATLRAPRVVMAWEDSEEPWVQLAAWSRADGLRWSREPPGASEPLVPAELDGSDFLCLDVRQAAPEVLRTASGAVTGWTGRPVHPELAARFDMTAVLGCELPGKFLKGRLFVLDGTGRTVDDLVLAGVVARQVAARIDQIAVMERLRDAAETEARVRLARDLHDGLMQSLTAAGLHIEAARDLIVTDPTAAAARLRDVQRLLAGEQRDLRTLLRDLKPAGGSAGPPEVTLPARLEELRARVERQWGVRVRIEIGRELGQLPRDLARDVHLIVHEAVVNAARHGGAAAVEVSAESTGEGVRITIADDGRGFPFRGRRPHAALSREGGAPASLWSRVDALGGSLTVDSTERGARLEIVLPLVAAGAGRAG
jgi:signal transduction histidine kinase